MAFSDSINRIEVLGGICSEITVIKVGGEDKGCRFNIACSRPAISKEKDAERKQQVDYIPCIAWGWVAKHIIKYYNKGHRIFAIGSWQSGSYEDKNTGKRVYTNQCCISEIHDFVGNSSRGADLRTPLEKPNPLADQFSEEVDTSKFEIGQDDLPF